MDTCCVRCARSPSCRLLLACASIEFAHQRQPGAFDSYPPEVQAKIRAGQIGVGFTPEMVEMAWGEPSRREQVTGEDFVADVWTWTRSSPGVGFGIGSGGYYGGNVGIGTGILVGEGTRYEDRQQVEFRNGEVVTFRSRTRRLDELKRRPIRDPRRVAAGVPDLALARADARAQPRQRVRRDRRLLRDRAAISTRAPARRRAARRRARPRRPSSASRGTTRPCSPSPRARACATPRCCPCR